MSHEPRHQDFDRDFAGAARLVRDSASFGVLERLVEIATRLLDGSLAIAAMRARHASFAALTVAGRLRLVGLLLLSAAVTHGGLVLLVPHQMAPALPFAMPALAGLAGIVFIVAAPVLADAWPHRFWRDR